VVSGTVSFRALLGLGVCVAFLSVATAQRANWRDQYDAKEFQIPARDGVKLYTVVYIPKDKKGPFPILMERTPYGAGSPTTPPQRSTTKIREAGYILAFQDVRGKGRSEGDFVNVRPTLKPGQQGIDETTDTYDTIEFLLKNVPDHNGRVGMWGISYPGFYAGAGAIRTHPALAAVSPQAPVNDWFLGDDVHHNGAFFMQETIDFSLFFDVRRGQPGVQMDRQGKSAYDFYLSMGALSNFDPKVFKGRLPFVLEIFKNTTYNDFWKDRALWRAFKDVKCAVLTVGGWFDKEDLWGALNLYQAGEKQNRGIPNYLVMGPWSHGQWAGGNGSSLGDWNFVERTSPWYQDEVEFPFFERYLRGDLSVPAPAEATVFETGANVWRKYSAWPPKGVKPLSIYTQADRTLSRTKPAQEGQTTYVADPAQPTPYLSDYATSRRAPGDWLARNQAYFSTRADVATFKMEPLAENLRVAGPIEADFWVKTTGTDMDLIVKVIEEFPADTPLKTAQGESLAGYQLMVRGEIIRAKFRNSMEKPEPILPGQPTRIKLKLNDVLHSFQKGSRIVVQVQSYWFPIADRNPNVFLEIPQAKDSDFVPATIQILSGGKHASRIQLGTLAPEP